MTKPTFQLDFKKNPFQDLRNDPKVRRDLLERAERIRAAAAADGAEGYVVTDLALEENRSAVSVMATGHAARSNRRHNTLLRVLDRGR